MKKILSLFIWIIIIISSTFLYSKKNQKNNLKNELLALIIPEIGYHRDSKAEYYISNNGHFIIAAKVNDYKVKFLLDTGASSIVLTNEDAKNANINVNDLNYNISISTANGIIYVAYKNVERLQISNKIFYNLKVAVTKSGLNQSLLGMSFLKNVKSYSINNNKLTINF